MINKIEPNQPLIEPEASSKQPNSAKAHNDKNADVSLRVDYASFIDKAMQPPQTDAQLLKRVKELLRSGQLESKDKFKEASEYMVLFGI